MKPIIFSAEMVRAILDGRKTQTRRVIKPQPSSGIRKSVFVKSGLEDGHGREIKPRYQPSDILWVRETWNYSPNWYYCYKADAIPDDNHGYIGSIPWKPSIHMPREAARIFLRVTNVRVERLWDITETDVRKEGFSDHFDIETDTFYPCGYFFKHTWNSLYAKRGLGWDTNPWVWVYEFEMINKPQQIHL